MKPIPRTLLPLALVLCGCTRTPPQGAVETTTPPAPVSPPVEAATTVTTPDAGAAEAPPAGTQPVSDAKAVAATSAARAAPAAAPTILVHKTPTCGCCNAWVDHLRANGFRVEVQDHDDLVALKQRLGVPMDKASCHTAEVGGYFVEGHVPAQDVRRLLADKPRARGITAPGMPMGSPGMEVPEGIVQPYTVELVQVDGSAVPYATHGQ